MVLKVAPEKQHIDSPANSTPLTPGTQPQGNGHVQHEGEPRSTEQQTTHSIHSDHADLASGAMSSTPVTPSRLEQVKSSDVNSGSALRRTSKPPELEASPETVTDRTDMNQTANQTGTRTQDHHLQAPSAHFERPTAQQGMSHQESENNEAERLSAAETDHADDTPHRVQSEKVNTPPVRRSSTDQLTTSEAGKTEVAATNEKVRVNPPAPPIIRRRSVERDQETKAAPNTIPPVRKEPRPAPDPSESLNTDRKS
jgi:hypothetical protein